MLATVLALIPFINLTREGIQAFASLIAMLHTQGSLSDTEVQKVRDDARLADADIATAYEEAKARIRARGNNQG